MLPEESKDLDDLNSSVIKQSTLYKQHIFTSHDAITVGLVPDRYRDEPPHNPVICKLIS